MGTEKLSIEVGVDVIPSRQNDTVGEGGVLFGGREDLIDGRKDAGIASDVFEEFFRGHRV